MLLYAQNLLYHQILGVQKSPLPFCCYFPWHTTGFHWILSQRAWGKIRDPGTEVPTEDFDAKHSGSKGPKSGARRYFPGIETWNLHL